MIKLTDKLFVTADAYSYVLGTPYEGKDKQGNDVQLMRNTTYYSTLAGAVQSAISKTIKSGVANGEITTLKEFIAEQKKLQSDLEKMIDPLDV